MKIKSTKIRSVNLWISLAFGVVVFLFFAFLYPFHLNYQEQFQLFLFTPDYFGSFLKRPGGFSDYIGNFFTQFYFYTNFGALILAVLLSLFHRTIYLLSTKLGASSRWLPMSLIPPILYWALLCDENYLLGGLIAILLVISYTNFFLSIKNNAVRTLVAIISLPVLYWLCGGIFIVFTLFVLLHVWRNSSSVKFKTGLLSAAIITVSAVLPFVAKYLIVQYPLLRFWIGPNYFRFTTNFPLPVVVIGFLVLVIPLLSSLFEQKIRMKNEMLLLIFQLVIIVGGGFYLIRDAADFEKEEIMAYDFHVRMRKWDRVIALAEHKAPSSPLSVTCLNLALAEQGLLADKMFSYYQNGEPGLIPDFTRDFTIPTIAGEVYYHLGFVNTAQRYAFEAMESLPDFQKSARCIKRLAETNIINGDYKVAAKYLKILTKTFYYRGWAKNALNTIKDENTINQHIEWGWLRQVEVKNDFLFSENEKDMMLGLLFSANPTNRVAYEYLMATCLLKKDMQHFLQYFQLSKSLGYKVIPKSYQEALMYAWDLTNKDQTKQIPYAISQTVKQRLNGFKAAYQSKNKQTLDSEYPDTFWYYYYMR